MGKEANRIRLLCLGVPIAWKVPRPWSAGALHVGTLLGSLYIGVWGQLGAGGPRRGAVAEAKPPEPRG